MVKVVYYTVNLAERKDQEGIGGMSKDGKEAETINCEQTIAGSAKDLVEEEEVEDNKGNGKEEEDAVEASSTLSWRPSTSLNTSPRKVPTLPPRSTSGHWLIYSGAMATWTRPSTQKAEEHMASDGENAVEEGDSRIVAKDEKMREGWAASAKADVLEKENSRQNEVDRRQQNASHHTSLTDVNCN